MESSGATPPPLASAYLVYPAPSDDPLPDPVFFYPNLTEVSSESSQSRISLTDAVLADIAETVEMNYFSQEGGSTRADVVDALAIFHEKLGTLGKRERDEPTLQVGLVDPALRRCSVCGDVHGGRASRERAERERDRELLTPTPSMSTERSTSKQPSVRQEAKGPI